MKNHFLTIDSETTINDKVADFAATITDSKGNILNQCAVLINGIYNNREDSPLFYDENSGELWNRASLGKRYSRYDEMLSQGIRMLASVSAINRWLDRAACTYNPILTAYNLPFDVNKCENTGIDLTMFSRRFCLWAAAYTKWGKSKKFLQFVLECHAFNSPTKLGNMTFKTNAEIMARFVLGLPDLPDEPHTALEDIIGYELPILNKILQSTSVRKIMEAKPYNWRECQVKDFYKVK